MDNIATSEEEYLSDPAQMTLSDILAAHTARLNRIESKLDDANNRLAILLELLRP